MKKSKKDLEPSFQSKAIKYIESQGGYVIKVHVSAYESQGEPDLVCCYEGIFVGFELKVKGNKPSKLQELKMKLIRDAGGRAKAVYSLDEIQEELYEIHRLQQGDKSDR